MRALLIALLAVLAVAWPAVADVPPAPDAAVPALPAQLPDGPEAAMVACLGCVFGPAIATGTLDAPQITGCEVAHLSPDAPSNPATLDPQGCWSVFLHRIIGWEAAIDPFSAAAELARLTA